MSGITSYKSLDNNLLTNDFKVFDKSGTDNLAFDVSKYSSSQTGGNKKQKKSQRQVAKGRGRKQNKYTRGGRLGKGRRTRRNI